MLDICPECGSWTPEKIIDPSGPLAVCPVCRHRHGFVRAPLFIVAGASGAGKSTVCHALTGRFTDAVVLDSDILWSEEFHAPDTWPAYLDRWLRLCYNIGQSGRPVLLFGAGFGVPSNLEHLVQRRYLGEIHYLALVCDDEVLAERLAARPVWRGCDDAFIEEQRTFNRWFKREGPGQTPPVELYDTTAASVEEASAFVMSWVRRNLDV